MVMTMTRQLRSATKLLPGSISDTPTFPKSITGTCVQTTSPYFRKHLKYLLISHFIIKNVGL